ncbi:MAG: response regulator transcription factor [Acetivibrio ethanolgignens]
MKVLLVDDEMIAIKMLKKLIPWGELGLELMGYAKDGNEAYQMVLKEMPDIIITDIRMGNMDGLQLVERVFNLSKNVKILLTSAYADFDFAKEAIRLGCSDYILKPVDEDELEEALRKMIEDIRGKQNERKLIDRSEKQLWMLELYKYMKSSSHANKALKYKKDYDFDFLDYIVFLIQRDSSSIDEYINTSSIEMLQEKYVLHILERVVGEEYKKKFLFFDYEDDTWILIVEKTAAEEMMDTGRRLAEVLQEELNLNVLFCFSTQGKSLEELPDLYGQVKSLQKYAFYIGDEKILGYNYNCVGAEIEQIREIGAKREAEYSIKQKEKETKKKFSKPVEESLQFIEANYNKNLSLDEICENVAVSKNYFCYLFKRELGVSLWNYLTQIRLGQAKRLLEETDLKTYEIAFEVGYDNPSYFSKIFKKLESVTPNEYRAGKREYSDRKS